MKVVNHQLYWIWLTNLANITAEQITGLLDYFENAEEIYHADARQLDEISTLETSVKKILLDKNLELAEKIITRTKLAGAHILTYDDVNYPDMLRHIPIPPYVLYLKGEIMEWDRILGIAVVGTRKCTDYGKNAAAQICAGLARQGLTIISGMARGIDACAAVAALKAGNKTIAVLGCGIDVVYPPEHDTLMHAITKNGAVMTEYPPGSLPLPHHFPARNRIISGLAKGTLVIEAPARSGTMITANYALETGKDLFAVPGNIDEVNAKGTNRLIQQGAKLVTCADDILEEYVYELPLLQKTVSEYTADITVEAETPLRKKQHRMQKVNNIKQISVDDPRFSALNENEKKIISILIEKNTNIDDISRTIGEDVSEIGSLLTILEMKGMITKLPGNHYKLNV